MFRRLAAWLACLAALMLVAQPAAAQAMAAGHSRTLTVPLCSSHDSGRTITIEIPGQPADQSECHKCPACIAPPALSQAPQLAVAPVVFAFAPAAFAAARDWVAPPATAPPRPLGQGPPARLDA